MSYTQPPSPDDQPFVPDGEPLPVRSGSQILPDDEWYNLKLQYVDDKNQVVDSFAYFVGENASWSFWDYISANHSNGPKAKFKKVSTQGNRMHLELQDGNYLSCRAGPRFWIYRSSAYPVGWEIVNGQLFTDYQSGPAGTVHHWVMVPDAYYMCIGGNPLRNCEWVKAT